MVVAALSAVMSTRVIIVILTLSLVVVSLAAFAGVISPSSDTLATKPTTRPLAASRLFMLLPDGKVEVTDAWARRVYRWDGARWTEVEVSRLAAPEAELR